jgi:hypothetical protein
MLTSILMASNFIIVMQTQFFIFQHIKKSHMRHLQDTSIGFSSLPENAWTTFKFKSQHAHPLTVISMHAATMASTLLMRARRGVTHSSTSGTHSVLTDVTNKPQEAKLKLTIDMYLEQKEATPACKQVKQNSLTGILDDLILNVTSSTMN